MYRQGYNQIFVQFWARSNSCTHNFWHNQIGHGQIFEWILGDDEMFVRAFIITIILVPMKCLCAFCRDNQIWFHIFVIAIHLRTILNIFAHFSENFNSRPYYSGYALAKRNQTLLFISAQNKFYPKRNICCCPF